MKLSVEEKDILTKALAYFAREPHARRGRGLRTKQVTKHLLNRVVSTPAQAHTEEFDFLCHSTTTK